MVGGGAWGTALACLARRAGRRVTLWSRDPAIATAIAHDRANPVYLPGIALDAGIEATADPESLAACDALLLVCPAQAVRDVARHLAGAAPGRDLRQGHRGIDRAADARSAERGAARPADRHAVGPELRRGGGPGPADGGQHRHDRIRHSAARWPASLAAGAFRPYWTHDVLGVALGGAVKNVLAIAAGIVEGRGLGHNAAAALVTRGFAEMARLGQAMGAELETLTGLSGLGDLVLTCHGPLSRNRSLGAGAGQGHAACPTT